VRGDDEGVGIAPQFQDGVAHQLGALGVHGAGRLVQQQDGRIVQHGPYQGQLLLHALGELAQTAIEGVPQPEALHQQPGPLAAGAIVEMIQAGEEIEVFEGLHALVEAVLFGQHAHPEAHLLRLGDGIVTGNPGPAEGRLEDRGQHAHGGGLARAVRPQQGQDAAGFHLQRHMVYRPEAAKVLGQLPRFKHQPVLSHRRPALPPPPLFHIVTAGRRGEYGLLALPGSTKGAPRSAPHYRHCRRLRPYRSAGLCASSPGMVL